ncbi:MAG: hypothetical protein EBT64_09845 [Gammaproteobacteria bacterium]|nr:hypothetical protein [Gammaproteobacteria bacterium]
MRLVIVGASGRMGLAIARVAASTDGVQIVGAVDRYDAPGTGRDIGELAGVGAIGVLLSADLPAVLARADVMVDFSAPTATALMIETVPARGTAINAAAAITPAVVVQASTSSCASQAGHIQTPVVTSRRI